MELHFNHKMRSLEQEYRYAADQRYLDLQQKFNSLLADFNQLKT
jgi:hypothetical protein